MILFPAEPFAGPAVDAAFADEAALAGNYVTFDFEALLEGRSRRAVRWVPEGEGIAVIRGWMMRPEAYDALFEALRTKGWTLVNSPAQYRFTHLLPESYALIQDMTPRSIWISEPVEADAVREALRSFGDGPVVVKDYVKSRKHEWDEACFVPDAAAPEAMRVVETFLHRQGPELVGGLVLREFEPFVPLARHAVSGMPLTREHRLFLLDGRIVSADDYWEDGVYPEEPLPLERFEAIGRRIDSRFFTMDVALRTDGEWRVVELGDGQVAGLPTRMDRRSLLQALARLA